MEAKAVSRYVRITPRKASPLLRKAILSARANAQVMNDDAVDLQDQNLVITEILIDEGPTLKRIRPRAQGRAFRVMKRTSHIKVTVATVA